METGRIQVSEHPTTPGIMTEGGLTDLEVGAPGEDKGGLEVGAPGEEKGGLEVGAPEKD